jgi:hypothetical protein
MRRVVAFVSLMVFGMSITVLHPQHIIAQQSSAATEPFKVLEGKWSGYSDTNSVTLTLEKFVGSQPEKALYTFRGRPVELSKVTATEDGKSIKVEVEGVTGLVIRLEYSPRLGGTLSGKAKPAGTAREYDITFHREK